MSTSNLPPIPRSKEDDFTSQIIGERRKICGTAMEFISGRPVPPDLARNKIENFIGFAQVPIGLAGPLKIDATKGRREVYVPMATTEGAAVASHSRGMQLLNAAGGARSRVIQEKYTQHPILVYADAAKAQKAAEFVADNFSLFEKLTSETTRHGRLISAKGEILGRRLVFALDFTTGDAVGSNMGAKAAELCSAELARETGAVERYVHGEDVEKRANQRAMIEGRGRSVVCDAVISRKALAEICRTTPEKMTAIWRSYTVGYTHLGTHNWTVQSANGLAAVMIACGQDVAYLTECATGFLDFDITPEGDLYAGIYLPSLLVGTVGGGTGQGTAKECLEILGVYGEGGANTFAEILAATALAGDVSLMAAFTSHEFVGAHEKLGRNRPE